MSSFLSLLHSPSVFVTGDITNYFQRRRRIVRQDLVKILRFVFCVGVNPAKMNGSKFNRETSDSRNRVGGVVQTDFDSLESAEVPRFRCQTPFTCRPLPEVSCL